jgi:FAD/FMN-containing dehydrogenase
MLGSADTAQAVAVGKETHTWRNWSGIVECRPRHVESPDSVDVLAAIVRRAVDEGGPIRVAGTGHSFTPLCATDGTLISLDGMQGVISTSLDAREATIWAGTKISGLGDMLRAGGVALENQGDVDYQALAGAVSTGTHGTGTAFGSLSSFVTGLDLLIASGERVICSANVEPALFKAAQLSLGLFGVVTAITMRVVPAFRLHERTWIASFEETMRQLDERVARNEHFEFFWLPMYDASAMKTLNTTDAEPGGEEDPDVAARAGTVERYTRPERVDWSYRIFASERTLRFVEMEFAVPIASGPACFRELRQLMLEKHRDVHWPIEYRTQRQDDLYISPAYMRDSVTLSLHQANDLPYQRFFADAEAVFRNHGGRPHWAKLHTHTADELAALYPMWDQFREQRARVDPRGRFLNPYLRRLMQA